MDDEEAINTGLKVLRLSKRKANKEFDVETVKELLINLFTKLGESSELTIKGRRRMSGYLM